MSKKIKKIIRRTRRQLTWPVAEVPATSNVLRIISDHEARTHTIYVPPGNIRDIEMLHELGHAILAETASPMFSTQYFAPGTAQEILDEITPASQAASDWFVDDWLYDLAPAEERAEIEEHLALVLSAMRRNPSGGPDVFCGACLMIAQGIKYCGRSVNVGGVLEQGVNGLLAVNPSRPTIANLKRAVSGLLGCYSSLRVRYNDNGYWEVDR